MNVPVLMSVCVSTALLLLVSCPVTVTGQMTQSLGWGSGGAYGRRSVESEIDDCVFDLRLLRRTYLLSRVRPVYLPLFMMSRTWSYITLPLELH